MAKCAIFPHIYKLVGESRKTRSDTKIKSIENDIVSICSHVSDAWFSRERFNLSISGQVIFAYID